MLVNEADKFVILQPSSIKFPSGRFREFFGSTVLNRYGSMIGDDYAIVITIFHIWY